MENPFNRDSFAAALESSFRLTAGDHAVDLTLAEVSELKKRGAQEVFSIVFEVSDQYRVEQGLYDLDHAELGPMQLFLVPVGLENGRLQLEAVFNFLRKD